MDLDYKLFFLAMWVVITFMWYFFYIRDIISWKTKPHVFSWAIWWILTFMAFIAQLSDNAWPWSLITWITSVMCLLITSMSLKKWEKDITKSDKYSFLWALLAIISWFITDNALYSILLITLVDAFWFYPTFRKSYYKPFEETLSIYLLSSIKFAFWIVALTNFTLITYLYPLSLVLMNLIFVIMLIIRRKKLSN